MTSAITYMPGDRASRDTAILSLTRAGIFAPNIDRMVETFKVVEDFADV